MKTLKDIKSFVEERVDVIDEQVSPNDETMVLDEASPPGDKVERFIKDASDTFKKKYGKNWERVLYATAWKKFGKGEDVEVFDDLDSLTEQDLHEISQVAVVVKKHRTELTQNRVKHQRELEKAKEQDTDSSLIRKKRKERERLAKLSQKANKNKPKKGGHQHEDVEPEINDADIVLEDSSFMTDEKFNMLLRHGLIKISQIPILRLAFKKLDENQSPSLIERQIVFGVMDKLIGYILKDPVVYNRIDRSVLQDKK